MFPRAWAWLGSLVVSSTMWMTVSEYSVLATDGGGEGISGDPSSTTRRVTVSKSFLLPEASLRNVHGESLVWLVSPSSSETYSGSRDSMYRLV